MKGAAVWMGLRQVSWLYHLISRVWGAMLQQLMVLIYCQPWGGGAGQTSLATWNLKLLVGVGGLSLWLALGFSHEQYFGVWFGFCYMDRVGQALDSTLRIWTLLLILRRSIAVAQLGCILMGDQLEKMKSNLPQTLLERVWRTLALKSSFLCWHSRSNQHCMGILMQLRFPLSRILPIWNLN